MSLKFILLFILLVFLNLKSKITKNYVKVMISIASFGSLINTFLEFYTKKVIQKSIWENSGFYFDFGYFFATFVIGFISSLIACNLSIMIVYYLEKKFGNYLLINVLIFMLNILVIFLYSYLENSNFSDALETVNIFLIYYVPGVISYYFFVYRPRKRSVK